MRVRSIVNTIKVWWSLIVLVSLIVTLIVSSCVAEYRYARTQSIDVSVKTADAVSPEETATYAAITSYLDKEHSSIAPLDAVVAPIVVGDDAVMHLGKTSLTEEDFRKAQDPEDRDQLIHELISYVYGFEGVNVRIGLDGIARVAALAPDGEVWGYCTLLSQDLVVIRTDAANIEFINFENHNDLTFEIEDYWEESYAHYHEYYEQLYHLAQAEAPISDVAAFTCQWMMGANIDTVASGAEDEAQETTVSTGTPTCTTTTYDSLSKFPD